MKAQNIVSKALKAGAQPAAELEALLADLQRGKLPSAALVKARVEVPSRPTFPCMCDRQRTADAAAQDHLKCWMRCSGELCGHFASMPYACAKRPPRQGRFTPAASAASHGNDSLCSG